MRAVRIGEVVQWVRTRKLEKACLLAQEDLWHDLAHEIHYAYRGGWSIACDNRARRLRALADLVGLVPWTKVPLELLAGGNFQELAYLWGMEIEGRSDMEKYLKDREP